MGQAGEVVAERTIWRRGAHGEAAPGARRTPRRRSRSPLICALDQAFQAHRDLIRLGAATADPILWSSEMRPFRRDPRFQAIAAPLVDYWIVYGPPDECSLQVDNLVCR